MNQAILKFVRKVDEVLNDEMPNGEKTWNRSVKVIELFFGFAGLSVILLTAAFSVSNNVTLLNERIVRLQNDYQSLKDELKETNLRAQIKIETREHTIQKIQQDLVRLQQEVRSR